MAETTSSPDVQLPPQRPPIEQKPASLPPIETKPPRRATLGAFEIQEDRQADLLTPTEKILYRSGFERLQAAVGAADNNIVRMVLTTPDMVSGIIGLQPLVSMDTAQVGVVYQAFENAGVDFSQDYSILESGKEMNYLKILVNDRAAENALRIHQDILGLTLPERPLQKNEILSYTTQLLNNSDTKRSNLAHGLLSGFPLEDCQRWVNTREQLTSLPSLKQIPNVETRFGYRTMTMPDGKEITARPKFIPHLQLERYSLQGSRNHFLPDTRTNFPPDADTGIVEGFGLRWAAQIPPQEATIRHAQKLLQVDRELGLLEYVNQQRSTFNTEDNIRAIAIEQELSGTRHNTSAPNIRGVASLAFGILASFASEIARYSRQRERRTSDL
jgi:hypothetical protein